MYSLGTAGHTSGVSLLLRRLPESLNHPPLSAFPSHWRPSIHQASHSHRQLVAAPLGQRPGLGPRTARRRHLLPRSGMHRNIDMRPSDILRRVRRADRPDVRRRLELRTASSASCSLSVLQSPRLALPSRAGAHGRRRLRGLAYGSHRLRQHGLHRRCWAWLCSRTKQRLHRFRPWLRGRILQRRRAEVLGPPSSAAACAGGTPPGGDGHSQHGLAVK